MKVLGITNGHDSAVSLVVDGKLLGSVATERVTRTKKDKYLCWEVIDYILNPHNLTIDDIDLVAIGNMDVGDNFVRVFYREDELYEYPFSQLHPNFNSITRYGDNYYEEYGFEIFDGNHFYVPTVDYFQRDYISCNVLLGNEVLKNGMMVNHHTAHAASVYYTNNLERAAIFSLDASGITGERSSAYFLGDGNKLTYVGSPNTTIGNLYTVMTEMLEFGPGVVKAGTTMGAAPYGEPSQKIKDNWELLSEPQHMMTNIMDNKTFNCWAASYITERPWQELRGWIKEEREIGRSRIENNFLYPLIILKNREEMSLEERFNHAASIQYTLEKTIQKYSKQLFEMTEGLNDGNLCIVGGTMLNCTSNYKLLNNMDFDNLYMYPATGDDGLSVGAALYCSYNLQDIPRQKFEISDVCYTGNEYEDIEEGIDYDEDVIAKMLSESKIVAWFQGRSEFGPRALGHRSFLANPTDPKMKEILNSRVKHREWFRPFAPIVLKERVTEWFDINVDSPYMLYTCPVKKPWEIPSVTHVDGTARVQTLTKETNEKLYSLIEKLGQHTGVPIVLNTSLNVNGQPIVETPEEAIELYNNSDIDAIVINNKMLIK
jgi:carbamoyltransferase